MLSPLRSPSPVDPGSRIPQLLQDRVRGMVLAAFFSVHRELGAGFSESVYLRALAMELATRALSLEQDVATSVFYKGTKVGAHRIPLVVEGRLIVEVVSSERLEATHVKQLLSLVRSTALPAGLLLHFGMHAAFRHVAPDVGPAPVDVLLAPA